MGDEASPLMELGIVTAPYGVRGWVKLRSDTEPADRIFQHRTLSIVRHGVVQAFRIEATGHSGGQPTVKFVGVDDRGAAEGLRGASLCVRRDELPRRAAREFYRADLIGCEVVDLGGTSLGTVQYFVETPEQALMVVRGAKEIWVPAVPKHLRRVDLQARRIVVDWDAAAG